MQNLLNKIESRQLKIAVIGLGYVGLPLAAEFGKYFSTVGFDVKAKRIEMLKQGIDNTLETSAETLKEAKNLTYTCNWQELCGCEVFIVTVPTPVDQYNRPDLTPLISASETVGRVMQKNAVVIYESTVYPGCTEEECVPVLARASKLEFNKSFFCGYSPERINPGDKQHTLTDILKITSGSTPEAAEVVDALYRSILKKGTHRASSIKVAEAAKVIENSQRDINIAFVNELAKIFHLIGIDTHEVLEAAGTKWNFLKFTPGLVGGHCIGVDPYYLTHKAQSLGYLPEVILSGRRINDGMGKYVATEAVKLMIKKGQRVSGTKVLQLGVTFKENCPDIRNSRAVDVIRGLEEFGCQVEVYDPWADPAETLTKCQVKSFKDSSQLEEHSYNAVILAVSHREFAGLDIQKLLAKDGVVFDVKGVLPKDIVDGRL
ncbi:MAG: nucleotide sugar dehydrogenase [Lentisphaeria bacterium]|nr:nucleotide sugar dehydrogenase [Lentisphaeria bacterium]